MGGGIRRLNAVVLTHRDLDHCGGLLGVVSYLPVAEAWVGADWPRTGCFGELAATPGAALERLAAGEMRRVDRWRLTVLDPSAAGRRVLLTGDIGAVVERRLLAHGADLAADLLKVAHHGSRGSSTVGFLAAVSAGRGNPTVTRPGRPSPDFGAPGRAFCAPTAAAW